MPTFVTNVESDGDIVAESNSSSKTVRVSNLKTKRSVHISDSITSNKFKDQGNTIDTPMLLFLCFLIIVLYLSFIAVIRLLNLE